MDLRQYFKKIRDVESTLVEDFPFIVSLETSDGGKAGVISEVSKENAAKLIVEGRAILASDEQKIDFLDHLETKRKLAEKLELSKRLQVAIIADKDLQSSLVNKKQPTTGGDR